MSSGDSLFIVDAEGARPPATDNALMDLLEGGSTPAEQILVYAFPAASSKYLDWLVVMPEHYDGGGLTCTIVSGAASATSGQQRWELALRRIADDAEDLDQSHSYQYNGVSVTAPSAIGEVSYDDITFTNGVDMDSVVAGEMFILRCYRDHDHGDDNMSGDGLLHRIHVKET